MIRVHTSDMATFRRCRRRWDWTSPMRRNLRPTIAYAGVNFNLAFGTAIHAALEADNDPDRTTNPMAAFTSHWAELTYRVQNENYDFYVDNSEQFRKYSNLGLGMLANYEQWKAAHDDYEVIQAEQAFEVPVFYSQDLDEMVYFCGRMDAVVRDRKTGRYGLIDYKTRANKDDDELYLRKLEMDAQMTGYMWAAEQFAKLHDLPYKRIDFAVYLVLYKAVPRLPDVLQSGFLSVNRQQPTTAALFRAAVEEHGIGEWFDTNERAQEYVRWLDERGDTDYIQRNVVRRNRHELQEMGDRILAEASDMIDYPQIYPNPTGEWYCLQCPFRAPCLAVNDGSDVEQMLNTNYTINMKDGRYTQ